MMVHLNGRLVDAETATVSVSDAGLLHGASVFTTMLAHKGVVFRLDRHLRRLMATRDLLGIANDATADVLGRGVDELLAANELSEARCRVTLTPGSVAGGGRPTTLISAGPLPECPPAWYEEGLTVAVASLRQFADPPMYGYKTGCYLPRVLAMRQAASCSAQEAIWFTPDGRLAEACFCNVFIVRVGKVLTPSLDTPVLAGIVREATVELCAGLGIACDDQAVLGRDDFLGADEIFLTSSCSGVRPVARVERRPVGDEKPGDVTKTIMAAYGKLLDEECSQ